MELDAVMHPHFHGGGMFDGSVQVAAAASSAPQRLHALEAIIQVLRSGKMQFYKGKTIAPEILEKKARLFESAISLYQHHSIASTLRFSRLRDRGSFMWSQGTAPFLKNVFHPSSDAGRVCCNESFYDYKTYYVPGSAEKGVVKEYHSVWAIFANSLGGGGCFEDGFLAEEIGVVENPLYADFLAANRGEGGRRSSRSVLVTRHPPTPDKQEVAECVLQSDPDPYLVQGTYRVQRFSKELYGNEFRTIDPEKIMGEVIVLRRPQPLDFVALSAPKLPTGVPAEQFAPDTLKDLLGNIMAGFTVVREQTQEPILLHSGRFGCGYFKNSIRAVYVLHRLAAEFMGVDVMLHGYDQTEGLRCQTDWEKLRDRLIGQTLEECINRTSMYFLQVETRI